MASSVAEGRHIAAEAIGPIVKLETLVSHLGLPRALQRISSIRQALSKHLPTRDHAQFNAESAEIQRTIEAGDILKAINLARRLQYETESTGDTYTSADYDRARALHLLGRTLKHGRHSEEALSVLKEAQKRFSAIATNGNQAAASMASKTSKEIGDVLLTMGHFAAAANAYENRIIQAKSSGDIRGAAIGQLQLGTTRFAQERFEEALTAYASARDTLSNLGDRNTVASAWHQIGITYAQTRRFDLAEQAYKESLALWVEQGARHNEAKTLHQLGMLYFDQGLLENAATLYRQAADLKCKLGNRYNEAMSLSDLGIVLHKLDRFDESREAFVTALIIFKPYGNAAEAWKTWWELEELERDAGRPEAAQEARREAISSYRSYRETGGEPTHEQAHFIVEFGRTLREFGSAAARALLDEASKFHPQFLPTLRVLHNIVAGDRDLALTYGPAHHPQNAVELALLLESLPPAVPTSPPPSQ